MALISRLFWHEFRSAILPRAWWLLVVLPFVVAALFLWSATPGAKGDGWGGFVAMPFAMVCGLAVVTVMANNPRNPATLNKTLPTPFAALLAGRLFAVFLATVFIPWMLLTVAMAVKFPAGFLATSGIIAGLLWLCFWLSAFLGTLIGESKPEALRHIALTCAAGFGPMLLYAGARWFVGRDAWKQNSGEDAGLNMLIAVGVFSVLLPTLCVSAWRMPFRRVKFRWYGPVVLMIAPLILCVPTARMISSVLPRVSDEEAPRVIASFPAEEGGAVRVDNLIATISPVYFDDDRSFEMEMKSVSLNSPSFKNWRNLRVVLVSEESKRFVVLHGGSMLTHGGSLLRHRTSVFSRPLAMMNGAEKLIRPRILLISGNRFSDHLMSGSTDEHHIPECFAFPPQLPVSEETSVLTSPPAAPLASPVAP